MSDPSALPPDRDFLARRGRIHQGLIEAEMRATRRAVLATFRHRLRTEVGTLAAPDFLTLADPPAVHAAIMTAALSQARADAFDLRIHDHLTGALPIARQSGLPAALRARPPALPPAHAVALDTGEPVLIDDVTSSPVFAGRPALQVMLTAGFRAVQCYPLHDDHRRLLGMLSFHYRAAGRHPGHEYLAWHAAKALSHLARDDDRKELSSSGDVSADRTGDDLTTVTVRGALDGEALPEVTALIERTLADVAAPHTVVVDLRGLKFLTAAGVRALFEADELCRVRGIDCSVVVGDDHDIRAVLSRLDVPAHLRVVGDAPRISRRQRC